MLVGYPLKLMTLVNHWFINFKFLKKKKKEKKKKIFYNLDLANILLKCELQAHKILELSHVM